MSKKNQEEADSTAKNVEDIKDEKDNASNMDNSADSNADVNEDSAVQAEDASDAEEQAECRNDSDPKDAVIADLQDRVKRQMAEFDNFRKRTDKEKSAMFEMGASDVIKKLLPVVDNFERGFKSITDDEKETPFAKGMDMVYRQMIKMLEDLEVKPIEAVGLEFNPDLHNAVMHVEDESAGEGIIVEEFEKGYTYRDTVIRHSMVKVAN
ncbi:MAG: nucleotide exchange factor GrpE [Clostridia bacterium]|nr:nucleotide exchange factor GrpE [Clostridia bacterium]